MNSVINFGLPIDENKDNIMKQVRGFNYSKVNPSPLNKVNLSVYSPQCMKLIGLHSDYYSQEDKKKLAEYLSGNKLFKSSIPISHCYCGH